MKKFIFAICLATVPAILFTSSLPVLAQSTTAGDIQGIVTDATGAAIPNATVTVKNLGNGASKSAPTTSAGTYRISLLNPGSYSVSVTAPGFDTTQGVVNVAAGNVTTSDAHLSVGKSDVVVEVNGSPSVVNTQNGDVVTSFTADQIQALPNPGNDLTYVAQTAPGSIMNTGTAAGGYGNFSSFGISGLSNMFTLDGGYENDPFLNLNNTGASNLTLGNNEVDTVTIVSPAYSSQFGGLGGAQVNEITTSGSNRVHGNLNYYWDGRVLNSNDWFNKQNQVYNGLQNIPAFVNANQWGAAIGGPIKKDRLFFFVNTEGIRATTPVQNQVYVPNAAFQACSLGNTATCATLNAAADANFANNPNSTGVGPAGDGIPFGPAPASQVGLLTTIYNTYNTSPFRPKTGVRADPNDVSQDTYYAQNVALLTEWILTGRIDYKISDKDNFYIHYKQDKGIQPTSTDLISPLFTVASNQPAWEGQMNETHNFSGNMVNQLVLTGNYYSAPFQNSNNFASIAPSNIIFVSGDAGNTNYGGINYAFPQGRRVSGYQIIDDLSYTKGRSTLRFGYNFRRDNITDLQGEETTTPVAETTIEGLSRGVIDYEYIQRFPQRLSQPVSVYNEGAYIEDAFKVAPNLTVTAGLRIERNSNPTCHTNCYQVLAFPVTSLPTGAASAAAPYNAAFSGGLIRNNRYRAFTGFQKFAAMPRVGINWQPFGSSGKTVIRGGFGLFSDSFPGLIAEDLLSNAPTNFHGAVYGTQSGASATDNLLNPASPGSGAQLAIASNAAFQNSFNTGGNYTTTRAAVAAAGGLFSAPTFTTTAQNVSYPTYEEFSLAIEQRIGNKSTVSATYVGNHGYKEPVTNGGTNLSNSHASANFFPSIPTAKPVTPFATITNVYSGASSNFNGLVLSATRRAKELTLQFNYEFSKALDEISNGGFEPFAPDAGDSSAVQNPRNLHQQYGPADYNVKHNTTASFVYTVPSFTEKFKSLTGGFELSGDVFHQSGLPYTIGQSTSSFVGNIGGVPSGAFANGAANLFARQLNNNFDHHCGSGAHALLPDGSSNPCNFKASFSAPTDFGQQGRNSLVGPSYTNINMGAFKIFRLPHYEAVKLKVGAQFFNLFNHPNFQNPAHTIASSSSTLGSISSTVGAPTSILGSTGGADASPRLIQLHGSLTF